MNIAQGHASLELFQGMEDMSNTVLRSGKNIVINLSNLPLR